MERVVQHHFKRRASDYAILKTFRIFPHTINGVVLELGCGTRATFISEQPLVGLDLSFHMIKFMKNKFNVFRIIGDARKMPFREHIYELVVANALLHHMVGPTPNLCEHNIQLCFNEVKRVVRINGIFHIREMISSNKIIKIIIYYTTLILSRINININFLYIDHNVVTYFLTNNNVNNLLSQTKFKIVTFQKRPWVVRNLKLGEHINFNAMSN